mgnify:CR=1 FL=1
MQLEKKYQELSNFLIGWMDTDLTDEHIVKRFVWDCYDLARICARKLEIDTTENIARLFKERLDSTISEGREILALEPFPNDWICDRSEVCYYDPEDGKAWLRKVLKMLQEEVERTTLPVPFVSLYKEEYEKSKTKS